MLSPHNLAEDESQLLQWCAKNVLWGEKMVFSDSNGLFLLIKSLVLYEFF